MKQLPFGRRFLEHVLIEFGLMLILQIILKQAFLMQSIEMKLDFCSHKLVRSTALGRMLCWATARE
jgi:hypothetical protein